MLQKVDISIVTKPQPYVGKSGDFRLTKVDILGREKWGFYRLEILTKNKIAYLY